MRGRRIWLWLAIAALAVLGTAYAYLHAPLSDDSELRVVALDTNDPERRKIGAVTFLGGIDIPRMGQNIGGLSGLRWDAGSGHLLAITDDARWVWLALEEQGARLVGLSEVTSGPLLGLEGELLTGKALGDSESLTRSADGGWLIGFERTHRVWRYPDLAVLPLPTGLDPVANLGPLDDNSGLETLASREALVIGCAQTASDSVAANCFRQVGSDRAKPFDVPATRNTRRLGTVPTDADFAADGTLYLLLRSYSPSQGNAAIVMALTPDMSQSSEVLVIEPPLTTDNFEGLAVREEDGQTYLYLVTDDNFSGRQRTLLMKFRLPPSQAAVADTAP